jgi:hypothetical protein
MDRPFLIIPGFLVDGQAMVTSFVNLLFFRFFGRPAFRKKLIYV